MRGWKANVRNASERSSAEKQENMTLNSVNSKKNNELVNMWLVKIYQTLYGIKTFYFIFCIHKMYLISAEGYKNAGDHILIIKNWRNLGKYEKSTRWFRC